MLSVNNEFENNNVVSLNAQSNLKACGIGGAKATIAQELKLGEEDLMRKKNNVSVAAAKKIKNLNLDHEFNLKKIILCLI